MVGKWVMCVCGYDTLTSCDLTHTHRYKVCTFSLHWETSAKTKILKCPWMLMITVCMYTYRTVNTVCVLPPRRPLLALMRVSQSDKTRLHGGQRSKVASEQIRRGKRVAKEERGGGVSEKAWSCLWAHSCVHTLHYFWGKWHKMCFD